MRSRLTRVTMVRRVKTGSRTRRAQFRRLLHQIIGGRLLDRREGQPDIRRSAACGRVWFRQVAVTPRLEAWRDLRQPFAVAAIEQQHPVPGFRPQHMQQIMRLAPRPAPPPCWRPDRPSHTAGFCRPASVNSSLMPHLNPMTHQDRKPHPPTPFPQAGSSMRRAGCSPGPGWRGWTGRSAPGCCSGPASSGCCWARPPTSAASWNGTTSIMSSCSPSGRW